jgi:hypothetical protein
VVQADTTGMVTRQNVQPGACEEHRGPAPSRRSRAHAEPSALLLVCATSSFSPRNLYSRLRRYGTFGRVEHFADKS